MEEPGEGAMVDPIPLPFRVARVPNNPRVEWLFDCLQDMPSARQKRLVMQARSPEVAFLDDVDAEIVLNSLGLRDA